MTHTNAALIDAGDLDQLIRHVDRLRDAEAWDELVDLRDRARGAHDRGRQLWPVASLCEYRLALLAPAELAASMLHDGAGRFAPGPMPEIVASTHTWTELADHLPPGPARSVVAHERVVRGEDLTDVDLVDPVLDIPLALEEWEPAYPTASYDDEGATVEAPSLSAHTTMQSAGVATSHEDRVVTESLLEVVRPWTSASNGSAAAVAVEGTNEEAMAVVGAERPRTAEISPTEALAYLCWTGASGGAHGRRRGAAAGRFNTWWAAAALSGLDEMWPPDPTELGDAVSELRWTHWTETAETGWSFRLAIEDPADGLAWAVRATDSKESN